MLLQDLDKTTLEVGLRKVRNVVLRGKKKSVDCLSIYSVVYWSVFILLVFYQSELSFTLFLDNGIPP